jgi:hypothetical protein
MYVYCRLRKCQNVHTVSSIFRRNVYVYITYSITGKIFLKFSRKFAEKPTAYNLEILDSVFQWFDRSNLMTIDNNRYSSFIFGYCYWIHLIIIRSRICHMYVDVHVSLICYRHRVYIIVSWKIGVGRDTVHCTELLVRFVQLAVRFPKTARSRDAVGGGRGTRVNELGVCALRGLGGVVLFIIA